MNNYKFHLTLVVSISLLFTACKKKEIIGKWDDNIKLSLKSAEFSPSGDSVTITTGGNYWWIDNIVLNNVDCWYSIPKLANSTDYTINLDSILVERKDKNTLFIKANKNLSTTKRTIRITLEAGDYFDYIMITQKGH